MVDATRIVDEQLIYIKCVPSEGEELRIMNFFSEGNMRRRQRNHCVPLLDSFSDPDDPKIAYIVMPFLRPVDNPPFATVGDILDFTGQVLEV